MLNTSRFAGALFSLLCCFACSSEPASPDDTGQGGAGGASAELPPIVEGECAIDDAKAAPDSITEVPCKADFEAMASVPLNSSLPGGRSAKVVLDRQDNDALYFQNSTRFPIHYDFASKHLSGGDLPIVAELSSFSATEYYRPDRRFVLGAVSYYEGPDVWALELSPYDTASAAMIQTLYEAVAKSAYFGPALQFHPTSEALEKVAATLPRSVHVIPTEELYRDTVYQPLTLGKTIGRIHFIKAVDLENVYLGYEDIAVLDQAPNDITVVAGLITEEFQTPLSHVNVLSQNRGTPNMGLRDAFTNKKLRALDGKWASFTVGPTDWTVEAATAEEAAAFWETKRPEPVVLPPLNLDVTDLVDIEDVTPEPAGVSLRDAIKESVRAWGGKAAK